LNFEILQVHDFNIQVKKEKMLSVKKALNIKENKLIITLTKIPLKKKEKPQMAS
jgi:hypothetical protein